MRDTRIHPFTCTCIDCRPDLAERRVYVALALIAIVAGFGLVRVVPADALCASVFHWLQHLVGRA